MGGVLFGAGWGYGGLCPGPAVVMAGTGSFAAVAWVLSMFGVHAAATLLAVTVLAFSDYYAYFQMFIMFLAMVLSGLLHGLVLLPALFLILF